MNILFVCTGNVCRSPIAESLLRRKFLDNNIDGKVDSAGFEPRTINETPDHRAIAAAKKHGLVLEGHSRIFVKKDFIDYDKIYVMDTKNYRDVIELASNDNYKEKVDYLLNVVSPGSNKTIPDPIYSGVSNFDELFDILDNATNEIIKMILKNK